MNQLIATGILITEPSIHTADGGDDYLQFLLKCPREYSGRSNKKNNYDIIDCYIFNERRMEWARSYLVKSQRILIKGEFRSGSQYQKAFVLVEHIEFAGSSKYKEEILAKNRPEESQEANAVTGNRTDRNGSCIAACDDKELPF